MSTLRSSVFVCFFSVLLSFHPSSFLILETKSLVLLFTGGGGGGGGGREGGIYCNNVHPFTTLYTDSFMLPAPPLLLRSLHRRLHIHYHRRLLLLLSPLPPPSSFLLLLLLCILPIPILRSPWYNRTGWLDVGTPSYLFLFFVFFLCLV